MSMVKFTDDTDCGANMDGGALVHRIASRTRVVIPVPTWLGEAAEQEQAHGHASNKVGALHHTVEKTNIYLYV